MTPELKEFIQVVANAYFWSFVILSIMKIILGFDKKLQENNKENINNLIKKGKYRPFRLTINDIVFVVLFIISMHYS